MRFMVIVKASKQTEAGILPTTEEFAAMGRFNEELVQAGMLQTGDGLHPTAKGARIDFSGETPKVSRGPFPFSGEIVAGYWLLKADTLDEVLARMQRAPFEGGEIEIRQLFDVEDFGDAFTPELREQAERRCAQAAAG